MASSLETVLAKVSKKVTPSAKERKEVLALASSLVEKVRKAAKQAGIKARVRVEGSVAKDTWIRGEPDIDIFMQVPKSMPRDAFGTVCLRIAKEATKGSNAVERFAEHPYIEAVINGTRVNIVPCYQAEPGEWKSATDRTPFHTDYVIPRLNQQLREQIRLLKRFMKGIDVYGAEIKVGGFSGYLCELLVLRYESFVGVLRAAADFQDLWLIDYEGYYKGRENELPRIFEEPLVVIDPVDKGRNVASAVREERLVEFVAASREFLENPNQEFFYPKQTRPFSKEKLLRKIESRESTIVFVLFGSVKAVPDILWGQLYKTQRSLRKMLEKNDFKIVRDASWSDEKNLNALVFEVENGKLPKVKKHLGPPISKKTECEKFLKKHLASVDTVSGPYIEGDRWMVEIKRRHSDIVKLLHEKLHDGGRQEGVAELISKTIKKAFNVRVNQQIMKLYSSNPDFAVFLSDYLEAKPRWLRKVHAA